MSRRLIAAGFLITLLSQSAGVALAQDPPATAACLADVTHAFAREHRLERAVLFGTYSAEDMDIGGILYDRAGNAWVKTNNDEWKSPADGFEDTTWTDAGMEDGREQDVLCENNSSLIQDSCVRSPRWGLLETKKTSTSDLILSTTQAIRALQCRLRAVCKVATVSEKMKEGDKVTVSLDGCLPMTYPVFEGCRTSKSTVFNVLPGSCEQARIALVEREIQLLTLAMSYDASYRSLLQFAGIFQEFLTQFQFPLLVPLWQTIRMLGNIQGIPCFQAECNE